MAKCDELLARARRNPAGLRFVELCKLAECHRFEFARQKGSQFVYKRAGTRVTMTFQDVHGRAKEYQVRQLLDVINVLGEDE